MCMILVIYSTCEFINFYLATLECWHGSSFSKCTCNLNQTAKAGSCFHNEVWVLHRIDLSPNMLCLWLFKKPMKWCGVKYWHPYYTTSSITWVLQRITSNRSLLCIRCLEKPAKSVCWWHFGFCPLSVDQDRSGFADHGSNLCIYIVVVVVVVVYWPLGSKQINTSWCNHMTRMAIQIAKSMTKSM